MRLVLVVALGGDGDGRAITITINLQARFWDLENMFTWLRNPSPYSNLEQQMAHVVQDSGRTSHGQPLVQESSWIVDWSMACILVTKFSEFTHKKYTQVEAFAKHEWLFVTGLWIAEFLQSTASTRVCIQMSYTETGQVLSNDKVQPKSGSALGLLRCTINHANSGLKGLGFHTFVLNAAW